MQCYTSSDPAVTPSTPRANLIYTFEGAPTLLHLLALALHCVAYTLLSSMQLRCL